MFYEKVKSLCYQKGISITELAINIGLSRGITTRWKNGSIPHPSTIKAIAEYFNVSVDCLLESNNTNPNKETSILNQEKTVISIGRGGERKVYEINDEDAALVNAFIEKMAKKNS